VENPKSETRNPKPETIPKSKIQMTKINFLLRKTVTKNACAVLQIMDSDSLIKLAKAKAKEVI
jgi:hypothetical protein